MTVNRCDKVWGIVTPKRFFNPSGDVEVGGISLDGLLSVMYGLKDRLAECGIDLVHYSEVVPDKADGYIFFDYQSDVLNRIKRSNFGGALFLYVMESELVSPDNWMESKHSDFDVVFTWDMRELPRLKKPKYVRYFWPNDFSRRLPPLSFSERKKLCVMVATNKWKRRPKELYTARFEAIRWFMKKHPDDFDLYGYDWHYSFPSRIVEFFRNCLRSVAGKKTRPLDVSSVYRGPAGDKRKTLSEYRFCICYENGEDMPGYITEKIFDCFVSGVVPVYLGWEDVSRSIPEDSFVDMRRFESYEELYRFLGAIDEDSFEGYLAAARRFLDSEEGRKFDFRGTVSIIAEEILSL
ncbi:MAG: glycosyltransferase family 10 [Synergistota bacterium]|nr:glycosyltransferase family 10 [Synergistota bacterium]